MGIEHYTRLSDLGGSNGAFLACDRQDPSRKVVIKRLAEGQEGMMELNLSLRARHSHIVKMLEFFIHDGELYGVIKYEEGGDLASLVARLRELEVVPKEVTLLRWFEQLLSALQFCHDERRIIHRDIKPSNIFLSADDKQLFLGDFGSAKALTSGTNMTTTFVGSPMWISPEVLLGHAYTFSSDVWSLGCVFFEMATLRHPFHAQNFAHLVTKVTSGEVAVLPDAVPPAVRGIIGKMLKFDPSARAAARDLLNEVRAALPLAEAGELASRRTSAVQLEPAPSHTAKAASPPPKPASPSRSPKPQQTSATTPGGQTHTSSAASSRRSSPATRGGASSTVKASPPRQAVRPLSPPPPPPIGLRTCTPTQMDPKQASTSTETPTREPATVHSSASRSGGAAVGRTQVVSKQAPAEVIAPIPSTVTTTELGSGPSSGHLRSQIEARLRNHRDSDSDSDDGNNEARIVEANAPLQLQGRRLSLDPSGAEGSTTSYSHSASGGRRGSQSKSQPRATASAGREPAASTTASIGARSNASTDKMAPAMRQRWYDRTPKPATKAATPSVIPAKVTLTKGVGKRRATGDGGSATRQGKRAAVATPAAAAPSAAAPAPKQVTTESAASAAPVAAEDNNNAGVNTWLGQYADEASDIELYLRKFRDHDDAVLRTYDEREQRGETPFVMAAPQAPPPPPAPARATPQRARQPSRRAQGADSAFSSPPRAPRRRTADPPVSIVVAGAAGMGGGGEGDTASAMRPPLPPARSEEPSPSPKPSVTRARPGAGSVPRRHKAPSSTSSAASPNPTRYFSPKYERQPSALRAPIVASHNPRQASHARPQPQYTDAEKRVMEAERLEAKERRETERERMKEMIKAQRAQKRRHSVDVEIKLPDDVD